jgi:hypothetical protein
VADAQAEAGAVEAITDAMPDNYQAAVTFLERRHPDRWAKRERHEITGQGGGAIKVELHWPEGPQTE